ncbi:MAG TPA: NUDIX hydrolase [Micromonosporaceae bacterium]|nr:NUDIX hydrolase [Micromonosporaceae bacterium]HCU48780.1 NUDIX hydrolase [Micromonosporaceae bacterium]
MSPLPQISVSVKAAVVRGEDVLLLSYNDEGGFHYNLPGGKARKGESLREAVSRKVRQETGLQVTAGRLMFVVEYVPHIWCGEFGEVHKVQFNFMAAMLDPTQEARMPDVPDPIQVGFEWFPLTKLPEAPLLPRVTQQLISAINQPITDPFVGRW